MFRLGGGGDSQELPPSVGNVTLTVHALHLHARLTSWKTFACPCAEFLAAIQHLSKVLQYDDITSDGVI